MAYSRYKKSNAVQNHSSNKAEEAIQRFANMMIERMTALKDQNWEKGWFNGTAFNALPQNYSGRTYNASNAFLLFLQSAQNGYTMPVYMTFKQAMDQGVRINKGEEAFPVVYWDFTIRDKEGNKISFEDYKNLSKEEQKECTRFPFLRYYPVFNVDQTNLREVLPEKYEALRQRFNIEEIKDAEGMYVHSAIDKMVAEQSWYCPIHADRPSEGAKYSRNSDEIIVPMKAQFKIHDTADEIYKDGMEYYSTLLHEMTHSTGSPERLGREKGVKFGDPKYAKEELVAELTAALIGNTMGFDSRITDNSAKYVDGWISVLKEDPKFIVSVMADVNKASEMILDKVDVQRLALGETPYLSKNMVSIENGNSLEPEFVPVQELAVSEPKLEYGNKIDSETQRIIDDLLSHEDTFKYQMLGRMQADCDYFLDNGNRNAKGLWAQNEFKQIAMMKALHQDLSEKPVWLPWEKILEYESKMISPSNILQNQLAHEPSIEEYTKKNKPLLIDPQEKPELLKQYEEMKEKHPDALILMRVGDAYELFDNDAKIASGILETELVKGATKNSIYLTVFNHNDLDTYLPKLVRAGQRVAICETAIEAKKLVKRGMSEENKKKHEELITNQNKEAMTTKKKKSEEKVAEKKEKKVKETPKTEAKEEVKAEVKVEDKQDENKEKAVKQPREPQMITVNGDKISHAHVFTKKDNPEQWYFTAKINYNEKFLSPVAISAQEADNYRVNKNVVEMMEKYYPSKVMAKVPAEHFDFKKNNEIVVSPKGEMKIEKFNTYKETNPESPDNGKYKFFAKVGEVNMSVLAKQEDLDAYFDRVKTPAQLVESIFGERLHLKAHYEQFQLPDGFDPNQVKMVKSKEKNDWMVYLDLGDAGKTKGKVLSGHDKTALFTDKTATLAQLGAKYLGDEINKSMNMKPQHKVDEKKQHKMA